MKTQVTYTATVQYPSDDAAKTLTLNGVTLTGQQMLGATDLPDTLTVVLIGNNVFENDKRGISHTGGDLLIKGPGHCAPGGSKTKTILSLRAATLCLTAGERLPALWELTITDWS